MRLVKFNVTGMQCSGCETIIETAVTPLEGIERVAADYPSGMVKVSFDEDKISLKDIQKVIEASGYPIASQKPGSKPFWLKLLLALVAVIVIAIVMIAARKLSYQFTMLDLNSHLSNGMILLIGLITGLHCIGMCGGFVISYTARDAKQQHSSWPSHILY